jgi:hypothetical protein
MHVAPTHALAGALTFTAYKGIKHIMRKHDETNLRPKIFDHIIAFGIIGAAWGLAAGSTLKHGVSGGIFAASTLAPMTWWWTLHARPGIGNRPAGIFYENDVTKEEKERYEAMDAEEILANEMTRRPGYGLITRDQRFIS